MAREPELSIKVKVDPQINPSSLKTNIERQVKQSGEKPQIEIDPNVDGIKGRIEEKLKNVKATAIVTPVVDTEKIKTDIQQQINGISDMPKVTVGVDVNNFSNELSEQLKTQLKEVNQQLSYYLKNLTRNTDSLNSFASDIFSTKGIKSAAKQAANEVSREFAGGLDKVFNVNDLFNYKISDSTKRRSVAQAKNLVQEIKDDIADLNSGEDNWTEDLELIPDNFNKKFSDLKIKALELRSIVTSFGNALNADEFKDILKIFNSRDYNLVSKTGSFSSLEEFLDVIISKGNTVFKTGEQATKFLNSLEDLTGSKKISVDKIFGDAFNELTGVQQKIAEINTDIKTSKSEIKDVQKSLQQSKNDDTSGNLDITTIETYGQKLDEVLSKVAAKQELINTYREKAVGLENSILSATIFTREGLSRELQEYDALLKKYDTDKISKFADSVNLADFIKNQEAKMQRDAPDGEKNPIDNGTYKVTNVKFDIDPAVLQAGIDAVFENVAAPIRLSLAPGTVDNLIDEITPKLGNIPININNITSNDSVHFKNWPEAVKALYNNAIDDTMKDVGYEVCRALELDADHSQALKNLKTKYGFDKIIKGTDGRITSYRLDEKTGYNDLVEEASRWYNNYIAQIQKSKPIDVKGKVTITDADVIVDVKNPVKIPGVAVIDSNAAQIGSIEDLKSSADALSLANKSLNGIISKTEGYVSNISALGPAFQYVAQEVDNLSRSLENQILDFNKISEQTNAYIGKAGSISIDTSNVAVTGEPTAITGKVVLGTEDVVSPETPVDIKGHVELKTTDITPPSEPVELQGKISKTTMESAAKGKKKKWQDVEKPEAVELNGHVKLEDKDIERPDPVNLNGAVKIKDSDIKVGDIEISKKKFDINGNLILKNAEILDAIKETSKSNTGKKKNSKPTENHNFDDVKAQQEANRLLLQEEQTQQRIADAAQRKAAAENKAFNSETASLQRKYDQAELDNLNRIEKKYKELTALENQRGTFTKPEKALDLMHTEAMIDKVKKELDLMLQNASETGYNPLKVSSIGDQAMKYFFAKSSADNKFNLAGEAAEQKKLKEEHDQYIKDLRLEISLEKDLREGRDKYGSDSDYVKQTEVDLKALKKKNRDYEHSVGYELLSQDRDWIDLTSKKRNQRLQYRATSVPKKEKQQEFLSAYDEYAKQNNTSLSITDPDVLKVYEKQLEEKAEKLSDDYEELVEILSPEELDAFLEKLRKKVQISEDKMEITKAGLESGKNDEASKQISKISKSIGDAKRSYNLNKENLDIDSLSDTQKAILDADKAISKIQTLTAGTDEYAAAVENANQKWREAELLIERDQKAQKTLISSVETIQKRFALLQQEVSQSSNDSLKTALAEIQSRAADLSRKDPNSYENYAKDLFDIKQDQYKVQAQYSIWRKGYKNLEKKGNQIAQGVEVARQMQEDGSLQGVDFKNIDELIAKLNTLPAQNDAYAETLKEIDALWQEIKKQVDAVNESEKQAAKKQTAKIRDAKNILTAQRQNKNLIETVRGNNGSGEEFYSQLSEKQSKLNLLFEAIDGASDSKQALKAWASQNLKESADNINSVTDAIRTLDKEYNDAQSSAESFNRTISQERSTNKAATEVANLKSQIHDYLETNKKIQNSELAQPFRELMNALNSENAPEKIGELKKQFAELRARSKELGLETESLIDKFEKLFGTHLSTMITMAALHKMQEALRLVYQNVVEIDTAVTELRKVSEYAGKSLEEYMGRAATQAQKLGVSISDYINSTADWKRLGYSDEDAENLATYSTLLRNVGDGIDDVNTSSSYLISTLKGFGLLASDAEDVVDKIDAVANTQPVTANDLGEILTRSSAAMSAANNTLEETIALGTAANSVIQDADSVGTMMKSLSMYLRAAKTEADAAGESTEGMANSVSELRSELKSLTGVDIMLDSKNFKSTYQIMKELSQVWNSLSDVTQANVTEMIAGKRNANGVAAILNNFDIAESTMESAANSANVAWEENEKYLDSIQGRLAQLDASFQALSEDVLSSDLIKGSVSFLTSIVKLLDKIVNITGALPAGLGIATFATQLGEPKMTGFMIVPSNTPGGDTEQACGVYYIKCCSAREYLVKPTNMAA